jgi:uncharacterized protein YaaW (UPF0174 family)
MTNLVTCISCINGGRILKIKVDEETVTFYIDNQEIFVLLRDVYEKLIRTHAKFLLGSK